MSLRGGRYELLGTIAAGGMATVHLGRALGAGGFERLVAIKTMHPHLAAEEEFVAMFLDEARLAARIRHPNVVATVDVQQDEQGLFLVMEYIEGPSLSRLLRALQKKGTRLPLDIAVRIFLEALAGLHAAHELTGPGGEPLELIHRDVSPHNILVGTDGITRITDFGVARAASRLASTRTGSAKGKITYMAPEHARSEPLDRRADIYSAGVVFWEMLTNERLVRGDSDMAVLQQITNAERRTPRDVVPEIPEAISEVTMRAIERDAGKRHPTAAAFAEALEAAARACGVPPAPPREVAKLVKEQEAHIVVGQIPPSGSVQDLIRRPLMSQLSGAGGTPDHGLGMGQTPAHGMGQTRAHGMGQTPAHGMGHTPDHGLLSGRTPDHRSASGSHGSGVGKASGPGSESIPAVGGTVTVATVALPGAVQPPARSGRALILAGAGLVVLVGGAAALFFAFRGGDAATGAAAGATSVTTSASVPVAASVPVSASVPVLPGGPGAAQPAATAPDPSAAPSATASATSSAKAAPRASASAAPKTFRPKEL